MVMQRAAKHLAGRSNHHRNELLRPARCFAARCMTTVISRHFVCQPLPNGGAAWRFRQIVVILRLIWLSALTFF
jgi:hypothetical protein